MDDEKKLMFLQNMTHLALQHAATTPNMPTPTGGMSHEKMLSFVNGIATKGLQHLAQGGMPQLTQGGVPITMGQPAPSPASAPSAPQGPNTTAGGIGGGLGNLVGSNNQFQATAAPINAGTSNDQIQNAYQGARQGLTNQNQLAGNLTPGVSQGANQQSQLAQMYLNQANGQGPNPALAQLNQATGQNIAQQAALAAGQRGAGANAGLLARENAQQGAATQQQAVGQAATMQAQQQLAAQQNLQNLSGSQISQGLGAVQGVNNAQQNEQNILQGANTAFNNANVAQQSNINNVNGQISQGNANNAGGLFGDLASGISSIASIFAHGGEVKKDRNQVTRKPMVGVPRMAEGGIMGQQTSGPQSYVGQWLNSTSNTSGPQMEPAVNIYTSFHDPFKDKKGGSSTPGASPLAGFNPNTADQFGELGSTQSGITDLPGMPGAVDTMPDIAGAATLFGYKGGKLMKQGGDVPGKAKVNHDSLKNDTVPAMLSPGEVVIDKDTLNDKGAVGQMARAVAAHIAKRNKKK